MNAKYTSKSYNAIAEEKGLKINDMVEYLVKMNINNVFQ